MGVSGTMKMVRETRTSRFWWCSCREEEEAVERRPTVTRTEKVMLCRMVDCQ